MKKLILSIIAMLFAIGANAEDFIFDFNNLASYGYSASDMQTNGYGGTYVEINNAKETPEVTLSNGKILIKDVAGEGTNPSRIWYYTNSQVGTSYYQYRTYKNHTVTVSMKDGSKICAIKGEGSSALDYAGEGKTEITFNITASEKINTLTVTTGEGCDAGDYDRPAPIAISIKEAINIINALEDGKTTSEEYIVSGTVSSVTEISTKFGNATFVMDGLTVFRCKDFDNQNFTNEDKIQDGDKVKVRGKLHKYVKDGVVTPELHYGYLVELNRTPEIPTTNDLTLEEAITIINALKSENSSLRSENTSLKETNKKYAEGDLNLDGRTDIDDVVYLLKLDSYSSDDDALALLLDGTTAITLSDISNKYGDVEFYTLNGVKVDVPTKSGIYVVKKNGETKMVVVKK